MPSNLRLQTSIEEPIATGFTRSTSPSSSSSSPSLSPKSRQKKMSLTQTYYIASSARSKLGREARRPDHDLRLLVGHANLLDSLMLELADAEREQEAWFNQTVNRAAKSEKAQPQHVQWLDASVNEEEQEDEDSSDVDSDSDEDFQMEDFEIVTSARPRRAASPPPPTIRIDETEVSDDEDEDEEIEYIDEENDAEHALVRTPSQQSPPELILDDISDDSEDDDVASPPTSPPASSDMPYLERQPKKLSPAEQDSFTKNGFFIPQRTAPAAPAIASF